MTTVTGVLRMTRVWCAGVAAASLLLSCSTPDEGEVSAPQSVASANQPSGLRVDLRRLTGEQYRNIIADVFGPDIEVGGRFEPGVRTNGLLEAGTSQVSITTTGFEQYQAMAVTIADQVLDAAVQRRRRRVALLALGRILPVLGALWAIAPAAYCCNT